MKDTGVWPDGLLDAYIAMIPKSDGDATPIGERPLSVLPVFFSFFVFGLLLVWFSLRIVSSLGCPIRFSVLVVVVGRLKLGMLLLLILRRFLRVLPTHVHLFVADVIKSFDTVDRGILDCVLV